MRIKEDMRRWLIWRKWFAAWECGNLTARKWSAIDHIIQQPYF